MTSSPKPAADHAAPANPVVRVRYEQTIAGFAGQFMTNVMNEEIIINFSSGYIQDGEAGSLTLPVQHRVAVTRDGARRLIDVLQQALSMQGGGGATVAQGRSAGAGFPRLPDAEDD